jgi:hypothetical protein
MGKKSPKRPERWVTVDKIGDPHPLGPQEMQRRGRAASGIDVDELRKVTKKGTHTTAVEMQSITFPVAVRISSSESMKLLQTIAGMEQYCRITQ